MNSEHSALARSSDIDMSACWCSTWRPQRVPCDSFVAPEELGRRTPLPCTLLTDFDPPQPQKAARLQLQVVERSPRFERDDIVYSEQQYRQFPMHARINAVIYADQDQAKARIRPILRYRCLRAAPTRVLDYRRRSGGIGEDEEVAHALMRSRLAVDEGLWPDGIPN